MPSPPTSQVAFKEEEKEENTPQDKIKNEINNQRRRLLIQ